MSIRYIDAVCDLVNHTAGPFNISGTNDTLQLKVDGGSTQTITLTHGGARTAAQVVSDISASISGATCTVATVNSVDYIRIRTSSANGANSTIQILTHASSAATTLGILTTTYTGVQRASSYSTITSTKSALYNFIEAAAVAGGWMVISGSGSTNILLQSGMTPPGQNLRMRLRVKDNSANCVTLSLENVPGTKVSTNNTTSGIHLLPTNRRWRAIFNRYQFAIYADNDVVNRGAAFGGVPWIPSNLEGTIYEAAWMMGNSSTDGDSGSRGTLRDVVGYRNNTSGGTGNLAVLCNGNLWENANNGGLDGIGIFNMLTLWQGARVARNQVSWYRWHDDTVPMVDPLIAWGLTANTDEGKIRGQLWESFVYTEGVQGDICFRVEDHDFVALTHTQAGNEQQARGAVFMAIT